MEFEESIMKTYYYYGMRLRGFAPGCQPSKGLMGKSDYDISKWVKRKYHDIIVYDRQLDETELADYELDYLGAL